MSDVENLPYNYTLTPGAALPYSYSFSFANGLGPWTSWMSPSVVSDLTGDVTNFTRIQAPGGLDPNHVDGIGSLSLLAHLSVPVAGFPGILDLTNATIRLQIRETDFNANGGSLYVWLCRYIPDTNTVENYLASLQVTNWANTGTNLLDQAGSGWVTVTATLTGNPSEWTYAGNNITSQGDWAQRYEPFPLDQTLSGVDATLHLVFVSPTPNVRPTGFIDLGGITISTATPAIPNASNEAVHQFLYGAEDQTLTGQLDTDGIIDATHATYSLVDGSATQGTVTISPTGAFSFTPNANYYGPTDFIGPATFKYTVTDGAQTSGSLQDYIYIAPVNDAPVANASNEDAVMGKNTLFTFTLRSGFDVDGDALTYQVVPNSVTHGALSLNAATGVYTFAPDADFTGDASFQYVVSDGQLNSGLKTVTLTVGAAAPVLPSYDDIVNNYLIKGDNDSWAHYAILRAEAGDLNASYFYGTWLLAPQYVTQNAALAAQYLTAASALVPDAALELADQYLQGNGVTKDYGRARAIYQHLPAGATSLEQGQALYKLATLDDLGYGGPQNDALAVQEYLAAANLGEANAMYTLGRRYLAGDGVAVSPTDAYFWLGEGLKYRGGPDIQQFRDLLTFNQATAAQSLTSDQITTLNQEIAAWRPGQPSPVNVAPVTAAAAETASGNAAITGTLLAGTDVNGDALTYKIIGSTNGTATVDAHTGAYSFTPAPGYSGAASFQYALNDGIADSPGKSVSIDVASVTLASLDTGATDELTKLTVSSANGLLANDTAAPGAGPVTLTAVNGAVANIGRSIGGSYGSVVIKADGSYVYTPDARAIALTASQQGVESFTYSIVDQTGVTSTSSLSLKVNGLAGTVISGVGVVIGTTQLGDEIHGSAAGGDTVLGLSGNDTLFDGGPGGAASTLQGGAGGDTYIVTRAGDSIVEFEGGGNDTIKTALPLYTLPANVENLTYTGTGYFTGVGNDLGNVMIGGSGGNYLVGGAGSNTLIGGAGNDTLAGGSGLPSTLQGGAGDDTYVASTPGDTIVELKNGGVDTVRTSLPSFVLPVNVENLTYTGTGYFIGVGNDLGNIIVGGAGGNFLTGGAGASTLVGGSGNDTLYDGGPDGLASTLQGGGGDDVFIVTRAGDSVVEFINGGNDTVRTTLSSFTLPANVENLTYTGTGYFTGVGNDLGNVMIGGSGGNYLVGGAGSNTLIGGAGNDTLAGGSGLPSTLQGGAGDDTYVASTPGDTIVELKNGGVDTVRTSLPSFVLPVNVENLTYTGTGYFIGVGNDLGNIIVGGAGGNFLTGGAGASTLVGGSGNDTLYDGGPDGLASTLQGGGGDDVFIVTRAGGSVVEFINGGNDTVRTTLSSFTLPANVEKLTYTGTGYFTGVGNDLGNVMIGGSGGNTIVGGHGANIIIGGAGSDTLNDGGGARSTLQGGAGDDTYIVTATGDSIVEAANGGTDTVRTILSSFTLPANVENLVFTGVGGFSGSGNAMNNVITGGVGNDTLTGGAGSDTFVFSSAIFGKDTIMDFTPGVDVLQFDHSVFTDAATALSHAAQVGGDVVVTLDANDTVTLHNTNLMALHAADFHIV